MKYFIKRLKKFSLLTVGSLFLLALASHLAMAVPAGSVGSWTAATLPEAVSGATSVVYNDHIYLLGGSGTGTDVYYATMSANGTISSWTATASLPTGAEFSTAVANNGFIYVMGGYNGSNIDDVQYAQINVDGSLSNWTSSTVLPQARAEATSVVYNGYIYVFGGADDSIPTAYNTSYYAKINNDGSVGTWNTGTVLPQVLRSPASVTSGGYVYVMGGDDANGNASSAVYYAKLNSDGSLGAWTTGTSLSDMSSGAAAVTANGYVYYLGGIDTSGFSTAVYYSKVGSDNSLGAWTTGNSLPVGLEGFAAVTNNDFVYVLGGYNGADSDNVYLAALTPDPADPPVTKTDTTTNNSPSVSAPVTGYGSPSYLNSAIAVLASGAIISSLAGLVFLRRQKRSNVSLKS
jgi:N-acetylneuraminic acid mutarotase